MSLLPSSAFDALNARLALRYLEWQLQAGHESATALHTTYQEIDITRISEEERKWQSQLGDVCLTLTCDQASPTLGRITARSRGVTTPLACSTLHFRPPLSGFYAIMTLFSS